MILSKSNANSQGMKVNDLKTAEKLIKHQRAVNRKQGQQVISYQYGASTAGYLLLAIGY